MTDAELTRRTFVQLVGAGLAACSSRPARDILPYANQPPEITPGVPRYYATGLVEDGFATGVVVEAHEGRPTKIEGNRDHPASLGATRAIEQAAVLSLYDPQRIRAITDRGLPATWTAVEELLATVGDGLHVLIEPTASPIVAELIARASHATVTAWSPFAIRSSIEGNRLAFGRRLQTQLDLANADVIVALDADLASDVVHARRIADRRRVVDASSQMNRVYAIEASYTATGIIADHRFRVRPSEIEVIAVELLAALGLGSRRPRSWVSAIARDLQTARGRAVVAAGEHHAPVVHALVAAINARLASRAVSYTEPVLVDGGDLAELESDLARGAVTTLVVIGGDPVRTAPRLPIANVERSVYCGVFANETAAACRYVVPGLHDLERWGVERARDGTLTPIQPLIEPLYDGKSVDDMFHAILGDAPQTPRHRVAEAWTLIAPGQRFETALATGVIAGTAAPSVEVAIGWDSLARAIAAAGVHAVEPIELEVRPHPFVHDGRYATNPWLVELPEPITKVTWDGAARLSTATATRLGVETGDVVALAGLIELPVVVVPGHADDVISVFAGLGPNVFALPATGVGVERTGGTHELAITQGHWTLEHRPLVMSSTLAALGQLHVPRGPEPSVIADFPAAGPQWAMSIDLTTCTGCSACVMACSAENNIPVVGKALVANSREMHWLRIDRYVDDGGAVVVQPVACQHCEKAPCEYVCPVEATTHSPDGLNEMAYNRCVGTRFCSNNCPYKVRRFNWFDFKEHRGLRVLAKNPDVTIRDRGVMEKCTYCVQRIRRAEIDAREADRPIGRVVTACQQACPSQAIAFGSLGDPTGVVVEHRARSHSYALLHDQGTVPRTRYLARIRNPNPEMP